MERKENCDGGEKIRQRRRKSKDINECPLKGDGCVQSLPLPWLRACYVERVRVVIKREREEGASQNTQERGCKEKGTMVVGAETV